MRNTKKIRFSQTRKKVVFFSFGATVCSGSVPQNHFSQNKESIKRLFLLCFFFPKKKKKDRIYGMHTKSYAPVAVP